MATRPHELQQTWAFLCYKWLWILGPTQPPIQR